MGTKLSQSEVISRIRSIHGNSFDLSKIRYVNTKIKILIGCRNHISTFWYETTPGPLFKGVGCPKCGVDKVWKTRKKITNEEFIRKSKEVHSNKYDYSKSKYTFSRNKLIVICKKHGEFKISPNNHFNGKGCKECGYDRSKKSRLKGLDYFIVKSRIHHGDKYNYDNVEYINSKKKVKIICSSHGVFFQSLVSHSRGFGCEMCGHKFRSDNHHNKLTLKVFIERCVDVWGDLYDFSKIKKYINNTAKVNVICTKHGEFISTPRQLMEGSGCYECGLEKISDSQRIEYPEFIEKLKDIWEDKYDVKPEHYESFQSFKVYCKTHDHYWTSNGSNFLKGHGCRHCGYSVSKGENKIFKLLKKNKINFIEQYSFNGMRDKRKLRCDFFLPKLNLIIEYNGKQHYDSVDFFGGSKGLKSTQKRDKIKYDFCKKNKINFEIIRYDEDIKLRVFEILEKYRIS